MTSHDFNGDGFASRHGTLRATRITNITTGSSFRDGLTTGHKVAVGIVIGMIGLSILCSVASILLAEV